jgi:O-antigen/teichoic acid export membrane protein
MYANETSYAEIDIKTLTNYSSSVFVVLIMDIIVWQRSEIFFLNIFGLTSDVGYYSLAYSFSSITISAIPAALSSVLMPALTERWGARDLHWMRTIYLSSMKMMVLFSMPLCIGGIVLSKPIISLLYGVDYIKAAYVLPFLLLSATMMLVASPASSALYAMHRPDLLAKIGAFLATMNICLAYYLVSKYGIFGAAIANLLVQTIGSVVTIHLSGKLLRVKHAFASYSLVAIAGLICGIIAFSTNFVIPGIIGLVCGILFGATVYIVLLFVFQVFDKIERDAMFDLLNRKDFVSTIVSQLRLKFNRAR